MGSSSSFARKGNPAPFLIKPLTEDEATCGRATLIAKGDLDLLIRLVQEGAPERKDLETKFQDLLNS